MSAIQKSRFMTPPVAGASNTACASVRASSRYVHVRNTEIALHDTPGGWGIQHRLRQCSKDMLARYVLSAMQKSRSMAPPEAGGTKHRLRKCSKDSSPRLRATYMSAMQKSRSMTPPEAGAPKHRLRQGSKDSSTPPTWKWPCTYEASFTFCKTSPSC